MLHIAGSSAENNKINGKRDDFIRHYQAKPQVLDSMY